MSFENPATEPLTAAHRQPSPIRNFQPFPSGNRCVTFSLPHLRAASLVKSVRYPLTTATTITTSICLATECTHHPAASSAGSTQRNTETAASATRSAAAGDPHIMVALRSGLNRLQTGRMLARFFAHQPAKPSPAKPASIIAQLEGSGTASTSI
jgi:hypothetical protein